MADGYIGIRISPEVKKELDRRAKAEERNLSQYVRIILNKFVNGDK